MFSFKAYFFNHDVYINEKYKYAAGEILTAYLNSSFYDEIMDWGIIGELKRLNSYLLLDDDMDYELHSEYNANVYKAMSIIERIHEKLKKFPPYNKIIKPDYMKLDDLINQYDLFFEDDLDDNEEITWETSTKYGTGEINDEGHGVLRLHTFCPDSLEHIRDYDKEWTEILYEFHDALNRYFNQYITLLESCKTVFEIFKPFVDDFLHHKETYLTTSELAKAFDEYNKTHAKNFQKIQCRMNSFRYKSLVDSSGNSILCEEINFEDLQSFLYFDFFNGIRHNYIPNKCKNCGKYFLIQGGKYFSYCDRKLKEDPTKTCRDVGSRRRYGDKCKNDPIWQTYNRAYKTHYARYMKKKMTISEFEEWSRFASGIRDKAIAGEIPFDEYYTEIRK
ncbi:MAG: hypothetical protein E7400_02095 [Ruminococcaceae bacterium]|nr:hypothetical protein [Oscillospiraceae bacterium]